MAFTYPAKYNTTLEQLGYMMRYEKRYRQVFNMLGQWSKYDSTKFYILNGKTTADGWEGGLTYHCEIVSGHPDQASADAALVLLGSPANHFVDNPGLTQAEYDSLPLKIRNKIAYSPKLTPAQWSAAKEKMGKVSQSFSEELRLKKLAVQHDESIKPDPTGAVGSF